jgi:hypothetical protein
LHIRGIACGEGRQPLSLNPPFPNKRIKDLNIDRFGKGAKGVRQSPSPISFPFDRLRVRMTKPGKNFLTTLP